MKRVTLFVILLVLFVLLAACAQATAVPDLPVERYLGEALGQTAFGGKVFCAYDLLGANKKASGMDVYVWALCGEYYMDSGKLTLGTASSLPVALHIQTTNGQYSLSGYEIPRDGTEYMPSIKRIFPTTAIRKMCLDGTDCYNERANRLEQVTLQAAQKYYGLK